ncbi:hypothetical protein PHJA_001930200 [Phtheirospermum japonicum]|uniref:Uncharacterized protein n=1 Tax=Phtheirospermum japonicum TaxID=374723 RepID=A0A830CU57_9LAMI|nr:hypothetical protein PHJA_001930200 [Phtheirospermum japonicum]
MIFVFGPVSFNPFGNSDLSVYDNNQAKPKQFLEHEYENGSGVQPRGIGVVCGLEKCLLCYSWLKEHHDNESPLPRLKAKDMARMLGFGDVRIK